MAAAENVREMVLKQGETPSSSVREAILARGQEAVPALAAVLADETLIPADAPGEGWAHFHAAELLAALGGEEAVRALVEALSRCEVGAGLFDSLLGSLQDRGPEVGPVALEQLLRTEALDGRIGLLEVLVKTGLKDERIYQHLLRLLEEEPGSAAAKLIDYGDARAIEPLKRAFDKAAATPVEGFLGGQDVIELEGAIRELGGTLDAAQQACFEAAIAPREAFRAQMNALLQGTAPAGSGAPKQPVHGQKRPGRNEPCWCGSGVKYKKCHAASDGA